MRKIDVPLMWRHVGAFGHITHVAKITVVNDVPIRRLRDTIELHAFRFIDGIEESRESVTETETAATAVANVENPLQLIKEARFLVELL
jgi:hypothetical protein